MSGKELREILAAKGILQKDIAAKLNITQAAFSQILRAQDIKTGFLEAICRVLDVKLDFFYGGTPYLDSNVYFKEADYNLLVTKLDNIQKSCSKLAKTELS